ncbi:S-adenosyl-L-methionine-dependent methyltransferase [Zychaea mexicana]|uniref:S-adenosyl-L-methionine-dependent methyltransferase n=1 Tax=Zychaea mexicana TaxID=64656 RepID=UPI0022FF1E20|nr:S-adenosyl-L-methionine-dependent methyltransferase [Zychaea mexicana]KAI9498210.1 S-adenosyl-L-methionine-dependent methyltransferase [Zychaea mexicana]
MAYNLNATNWRGIARSSGSAYAPSEYTASEIDPKEEEDWDDWERESAYDADPKCLFCSDVFDLPEDAFHHCKEAHGFDFLAVKRSLGLDFYKCIRMINYIRKQVLLKPDLANTKEFTLTGTEDFWEDDELLQPVLEDDALLFAFEELEVADDDQLQKEEERHRSANKIDFSSIKPNTELESQLLQMLKNSSENSKQLQQQFEEYKNMVKSTFLSNIIDDTRSVRTDGVPKIKEDPVNYYFEGYAQNDIHEQMLKDKARTEAYRDFMYENKDVFKDKTVLDVGCGTGILSMFAAKAGAKKVFAVDNSNIVEKARANIKENGLDRTITVIRGKVEEIPLPVSQVDIIVSEWMGYFLLFEAMLDSVLVARNRWLAPNGIMAPSQTRILMAALDDEDLKNDRFNFWDDVYGFKMSAMKEPVLNEALVEFIKPHTVISSTATLKDLYLQQIVVKQLDFSSKFEIEVLRDGTVYAFGGWFDTWFTRDGHPIPLAQQAQKVQGETYLTTSPFGEDTHWKQTIFVLQKPIPVQRGTKIHGVFTCHKGLDNPRELECGIQYSVDDSTDVCVQNFTLRS